MEERILRMTFRNYLGFGFCGLLVLWIAYALWQGYCGIFRWKVSKSWRRFVAWLSTLLTTPGQRASWGMENPQDALLAEEVREGVEASATDPQDVRRLVEAGAAPPRVRLAILAGTVWIGVAILSTVLLGVLLVALL